MHHKKLFVPTVSLQLNFHYLEQYIISVLLDLLSHSLLRVLVEIRTIYILLKGETKKVVESILKAYVKFKKNVGSNQNI